MPILSNKGMSNLSKCKPERAQPQAILDQGVWDEVTRKLQSEGVATVDLPSLIEERHAFSFGVARKALEFVNSQSQEDGKVLRIPVDADSAHATGYHTAGGENSLSRYNTYREGFVFSDDQTFGINDIPEFQSALQDLFTSLHDISDSVILAIERYLSLSENWFQNNLGPTRTSSQFHVKRYVQGDDVASNHHLKADDDQKILLPMHTDPSLVSVIILDRRGRNPSAMGLQCYLPDDSSGKRSWKEVPWHGHGVAIIFVGSVLSYLTGNQFPSIKHRVIKCEECRERVAATLFVRPQLSAQLQVPPSAILDSVQLRNGTFADWIARVSRNYSKAKKKK